MSCCGLKLPGPKAHVLCPRCKGRRVVFNWESLMLTVALPFALWLDQGEDRGVTKRECPTCHGDGFLKMP